MSGSDNPPDEIPKELDNSQAVLYRIGEYIEMFNRMEWTLTLLMSELLGVETKIIQFVWKDTFTDQKIKTVRRAAIEKFKREDFRRDELVSLLNNLRSSIEFRNNLIHGYFQRVEAGMLHGKLGQSLKYPSHEFHGLEELTPERVYDETSALCDFVLDLQAWVSTLGMGKK